MNELSADDITRALLTGKYSDDELTVISNALREAFAISARNGVFRFTPGTYVELVTPGSQWHGLRGTVTRRLQTRILVVLDDGRDLRAVPGHLRVCTEPKPVAGNAAPAPQRMPIPTSLSPLSFREGDKYVIQAPGSKWHGLEATVVRPRRKRILVKTVLGDVGALPHQLRPAENAEA